MTTDLRASEPSELAVITGSGADSISSMRLIETLQVDTPFGEHATGLARVEWRGRQIIHLPRHGNDHAWAPHRINYRANVWVLQQLGVANIIALGAVGGIHPDLLEPGSLVVPDQLIDYTFGREGSFFDGVAGPLKHIDFTEPFDAHLRNVLVSAANKVGLACTNRGVYGVTQGPRLETTAEIERLHRNGCDLVGMTAMPEAVLARELNLNYGFLAVVVNAAAGRGSVPIMAEFEQQMAGAMSRALRVIEEAVSSLVAN